MIAHNALFYELFKLISLLDPNLSIHQFLVSPFLFTHFINLAGSLLHVCKYKFKPLKKFH